jgi:hypothetical protein
MIPGGHRMQRRRIRTASAGLGSSKTLTFTMSFVNLPPELLDTVMDNLQSDTTSLIACSLVCKAWLPSARRHIFATMQLSHPERHFCQFLKSCSRSAIIPFIRHLDIVGKYMYTQNLNECLPQLVEFTEVNSLTLSYIRWYILDAQTKVAFFSNFATIVRLSLSQIDFKSFWEFAQFVCAFPCMETLVVESALWGEPFSIASTTLRLPSNLRTLDLRGCSKLDLMNWFLSFEKTPALHTVHLQGIWNNQTEGIGRFLQALGPSLERFSWMSLNNHGMSLLLDYRFCSG